MTIAAGDQALASDINDEFAKIKRIRKTADETVNDNSVLQDDDHLLFAMLINEVWEVSFIPIIYSVTIDPGIKFSFSVPAGATFDGYAWYTNPSNAHAGEKVEEGKTIPMRTNNLNQCQGIIRGIVVNGGTAGNFNLQWAQYVATPEDTKLLKNSCLIAHKLA